MSSAVEIPVLDNTMGALFVGNVFAMGLWGAGTVQMYYYFNANRADIWPMKFLVFLVWALDTAHQALFIQSIYVYLITEYGNQPFLSNVLPVLPIAETIGSIIGLLVQSYLVLRVWILSNKNLYLVLLLGSLVLLEFGFTIAYASRFLGDAIWFQLSNILYLSRILNAMNLATDGAIAITLITLFLQQRASFSATKGDLLINRVLLFTVSTGLLTTICAFLSLIFIAVLPSNFVYLAFLLNISRLYTNTIFANLNGRKSQGPKDKQPNFNATFSLPMMFLTNRGNEERAEDHMFPMHIPPTVSIKVDREITRDYFTESSKNIDFVVTPANATDGHANASMERDVNYDNRASCASSIDVKHSVAY